MRVALTGDPGLFLEALTKLSAAADVEVLCRARNGDELLAFNLGGQRNAVLPDIRMPHVLVLSTYAGTAYAMRLLSSGNDGVRHMFKGRVDDVESLIDTLQRVIAGRPAADQEIFAQLLSRRPASSVLDSLSPRELEVLALMAEGRSNHGIGQAMYLSSRTIEAYVASVFVKLGLPCGGGDNRRVLAVRAWLRDRRTGQDCAG